MSARFSALLINFRSYKRLHIEKQQLFTFNDKSMKDREPFEGYKTEKQ